MTYEPDVVTGENPTVPVSPPDGDDSLNIATTEWVQDELHMSQCVIKTGIDYTLTNDDETVMGDPSGSDRTFYMPANPEANRYWHIKKITDSKKIMVDGNGRDIDLETEYELKYLNSITVFYCATDDKYWVR